MTLRQLSRNLALSMASVLICLGLAEGILFLSGFEKPDTGYFRRDARLGFVLEPGEYPGGVRINSHGFRGPDLREQGPRRLRIIALGDSCTFGVNLADEGQTYPRQLERLLQEKGVDAEVINAGVPGYTSFQGRLLTDDLDRLRPDAVTVYYGWNDHWLGGLMSDDALASYPLLLDLHLLASESRVYHAMKRVLRQSRRRELRRASVLSLGIGGLVSRLDTYRVPVDDYEENLEAIVSWAATRGIRIILITAPQGIDTSGRVERAYRSMGRIKASDEVAPLHEAYNARARVVARRGVARLVDAEAILRRHGNAFFEDGVKDPVHPDAAGHALIAEALAGQLAGLVPRQSPGERRSAAVDAALRKASDWYLTQVDELVCGDTWLDQSDVKYMWFMWRTADLARDFALKRSIERIMKSCGRVDSLYEIYQRLLPPGVTPTSFGLGAQVALGIHEDATRWAVNCDRYTLGDSTRARLFGTRYLEEHAGNLLNRKSYALTHILLALLWLEDTEPLPGSCVDRDVLHSRMRELANRIAWEHYTGLDNLGGYDGTRRRDSNGKARYVMQDITGQRIGMILEAGYPELVRPEWLDHLVRSQNEDGGWSPNLGQPSSRHTSMCAMWALALARHKYPEELGYSR